MQVFRQRIIGVHSAASVGDRTRAKGGCNTKQLIEVADKNRIRVSVSGPELSGPYSGRSAMQGIWIRLSLLLHCLKSFAELSCPRPRARTDIQHYTYHFQDGAKEACILAPFINNVESQDGGRIQIGQTIMAYAPVSRCLIQRIISIIHPFLLKSVNHVVRVI